jgi:hypothetical protein
MSGWQTLLHKSAHISPDDWFTAIAGRMLSGSRIVAGGKLHRIVEIEFYWFAAGHTDPFSHRHPLQKQLGRWYFHRTGNSYRNGSFKGLDLTISDGTGFGGMLVRSIEKPDGQLVDGPSLCVDYLLTKSGFQTVPELDEEIGSKVSWDPDNPLLLQTEKPGPARTIFRTARIGLSLKKGNPDVPRYILRPYRFLTEPRRIRKGKLHLVLALHVQGVSPDQIRQTTGSPLRSVQRCIDDFEVGREENDLAAYVGIDLGPRELSRLHGLWQRRFGTQTLRKKTMLVG